MRKIVSLLVVCIVVMTVIPFTVSASNDVQVFVNGVQQHFDPPAKIVGDSTYVPIRYVVEATNSTIDWNDQNSIVHIYSGDKEIVFKIGSSEALVNGTKKEIPVSFIEKDRSMIPIRFVSEQLGLNVDWNGEKRHVYITDGLVETTSDEIQNKATRQTVLLTEQEKLKATQLLNDSNRIERMENIIAEGKLFLGIPYKYGARVGDTSSFDCSSFIAYLFQQQSITYPRVASDQATIGMKIPFEDIHRGDLLFFDTALNGNIEHVGIYLGNNEMLHVSTSRGVQITQLFDYWQERYVVATRY